MCNGRIGSPAFRTVRQVLLPWPVTDPKRTVQPASLKWQEDGELSPQDVFNLVCRLREVEPGDHSNELWRLSHKYPSPKPPAEPGEPQA